MTQQTYKLSTLHDDTQISMDESGKVITAGELKKDIITGKGFYEYHDWYIAEDKKWEPNAEAMLETYIDNKMDDMYEEWDERAKECITVEGLKKLQAVLDEMFHDEHATKYWVLSDLIEIDLQPSAKEDVPKAYYDVFKMPAGSSIDEVVDRLKADAHQGHLTRFRFNGVWLYSDTVDLEEAYLQITKKPKSWHDEEMARIRTKMEAGETE